jgi:hypothetical protein
MVYTSIGGTIHAVRAPHHWSNGLRPIEKTTNGALSKEHVLARNADLVVEKSGRHAAVRVVVIVVTFIAPRVQG